MSDTFRKEYTPLTEKQMKKTKKITRKGCRNVQLVWHEYEDGSGSWYVEKIHPEKPAVFVSKGIELEFGLTKLRAFKRYTQFPRLLSPFL